MSGRSGIERGGRRWARATGRTAGWILPFLLSVALAAASEPVPLAAAIDAIVEADAVGPLSPPCSDADFVRRAHLDLVGTIPTAERARQFLADSGADKRSRLVDELLASPGHARHLALVLDGVLLERKGAGDLGPAWRDYLAAAMHGDRPLDVVCGECIAADGGDPATRPAATFFLARDAEPVQMTRSIGRVFFGRDLQCAQCHDHPDNADIRQADFHGLNAFLVRTSVFRAEGDPKPFLGEKADGEVEFVSVFTKEGQKGVRPRVPAGETLAREPLPEPGDDYATAPAKNVRPVPAHSRRKALATMLGRSEEFRRTMANRLWASMTGRGLVHPLDGHDPDNTPEHPRLLALLADALRDGGFRVRPLLRGIALSRTYGRAVEPPALGPDTSAGLDGLVERLAAERPALEAAVGPLREAARAAEQRFADLLAADTAILGELAPLLEARSAARKAADAAATARTAAEEALARTTAQAATLAAAAKGAGEAATLLPDDKELAAAAATVAARAEATAAAIEPARGLLATKASEHEGTLVALGAARLAADTVAARRTALEEIAAADAAAADARRACREAGFALADHDRRLALARDLLRLPQLAGADPVAATALRESVLERMTAAGQVGRLRALSAEQLAFAVLTASGSIESFRTSAEAKVEKEPPETLKNAAPPALPVVRALAVETQTVHQAAGFLATVAGLFADPLASEFQSSVNQALWLGNSPEVAGWLRPGGANLAARLAALPDDGLLAVEAYLALFSRYPDAEEKALVAAALAGRGDDRTAAIAELLGAMLSSNEFRFNH